MSRENARPISPNRPQDRCANLGRRRFLQLGTAAGAGLVATALSGTLAASASAATPDTSASGTTASEPPVSPDLPADASAGDPARPSARRTCRPGWRRTTCPGTWPTFWTGRITAMAGLCTIDGEPFLFLGAPSLPNRNPFPSMRQISVRTTATTSKFVLQPGGRRAHRHVPVAGRAGRPAPPVAAAELHRRERAQHRRRRTTGRRSTSTSRASGPPATPAGRSPGTSRPTPPVAATWSA